jgi:hypothetical protein
MINIIGELMSKIFSVAILSAFSHSKETIEILAPYAEERKQSEFIRNAILNFATARNFESIILGDRPRYIGPDMWQKIVEADKKSHYVDYNYVVAFFWLTSLPEFKKYNRSKLMREIIESKANHRQ